VRVHKSEFLDESKARTLAKKERKKHMGQQLNKMQKRSRRAAHIKRKKVAAKTKTKTKKKA
jgi:hypothetical protein